MKKKQKTQRMQRTLEFAAFIIGAEEVAREIESRALRGLERIASGAAVAPGDQRAAAAPAAAVRRGQFQVPRFAVGIIIPLV